MTFKPKTIVLFLVLAAVACGDDDAGADGGVQNDAALPSDAHAPDVDLIDAPDETDRGIDAEPVDAGPPPLSGCVARGAEIIAATTRTLVVTPAGNQVQIAGEIRTLRQVVNDANAGDTILLEDGLYTFEDAAEGSFTGLYFTTPNVTLRSRSGNAAAVILDSAYVSHGGSSAPITVAAPGVVLADFTVRRSVFHLIHLWADGDDAVIHNVHLVDGGQQFLKSSPGDDATVDNTEVSCSEFRMTATGRTNVWGYGAADGGTRCYTGGIDSHEGRNWHVHDSLFVGIYCSADGTPRPAHGRSPGERDGRTYTGGLAEFAIHMWDSESGTAHLLERNTIIDCARGIGLGLRADVYGTMIRNNTISSSHAGGSEHDVGISIERGHEIKVLNNTVFFSSAEGYANAIEYRWEVSTGLQVWNNLTNRRIRSRNGAEAALAHNVDDAESMWFVDAAAGDLHLQGCDEISVVGMGMTTEDIRLDLDREERGDMNDIGADHCQR